MNAPEHSELPLPDYDHLPLPALGHRVRSLTADQVAALAGYERAHANRPAAAMIFERRLAELRAGEAPSPGTARSGPEWPPPPAGGSPVGPAQAGPPANPPPHGVPAQPAKPKADRSGA